MGNNSPLNPWDKFVPYNDDYRKDFQGSDGDYFKALFDVVCHSSGIRPYEEQFKLSAPDDFSVVDIGSNPALLRFWEFLTELSGKKRILEIGTFIGLSAMAFARATGPTGHVTSVEKFDYFADFANQNIEANGFGHQIDILVGDAFEMLDDLKSRGPFDIVFIDGNKERYDEYFLALENTVAPGGLVIVDDCLFHGDALNDIAHGEKGLGAQRMLKLAAARTDYSRVLLPIGNGALLMRKLA